MSQPYLQPLGGPVEYIIAKDFTVSQLNHRLTSGDTVLFDGVTLTVPGYNPVSVPQFRQAIHTGWAVARNQPQTASTPDRPNLRMTPANSGNPLAPAAKIQVNPAEVYDHIQVAGTASNHAANTKQANKMTRAQLANRDRDRYRGRRPSTVSDEIGDAYSAKVSETPRELMTESKSYTNILGREYTEHKQIAESVQIEPGRGLTREEVLERMTPEEQDIYLARLEAQRNQHQMEVMQRQAAMMGMYAGMPQIPGMPQMPNNMLTPAANPYIQPTPFGPPPQPSPYGQQFGQSQVVGKIGTSVNSGSSDGIQTSVQIGSRNTGMLPQQQVRTTVEDGITFTQSVQPLQQQPRLSPEASEQQKSVLKKSENMRRQTAKMLCPDFPDNYDFDASLRKKIARLQADYEDRPDVMRAVFVAETDEVKAELIQAFPGVFEG